MLIHTCYIHDDQMMPDHVPADATAIVLSVGGNDGLRMLGALQDVGMHPWRVTSKIMEIRGAFRARYEQMVCKVLSHGVPLIICNVYAPNHDASNIAVMGPGARVVASIGVRLINGVIASTARKHRLPLLDLFSAFNQTKDYANPIEPSVWGGDKISNNIIAALTYDPTSHRHATFRQRGYSADSFADSDEDCPRAPGDLTRAGVRTAPSAYNERFRRMDCGRTAVREASDGSCDSEVSCCEGSG